MSRPSLFSALRSSLALPAVASGEKSGIIVESLDVEFRECRDAAAAAGNGEKPRRALDDAFAN